MYKPRSIAEVYNDLDSRIVNLFRILRDPVQAERLEELLMLTPFARQELETARKHSDDPIEEARRLLVCSFMGRGPDSATRGGAAGFRKLLSSRGQMPAQSWVNYAPEVVRFTRRLQGVVIENRDAIDLIVEHDSPDTLYYVDPPYMTDLRTRGGTAHSYAHDLDDEEHERLLNVLLEIQGMVVLSSYRNPLYDRMLVRRGWGRTDIRARADLNRERIESLYLSPNVRPTELIQLEL